MYFNVFKMNKHNHTNKINGYFVALFLLYQLMKKNIFNTFSLTDLHKVFFSHLVYTRGHWSFTGIVQTVTL